eukprot:scaffold66351_cov63-Phaeocystis_antarctica.AAC.2
MSVCTRAPSSCVPTTLPLGRSRTITDGLCTTRYAPRSGLRLSATLLPTAMGRTAVIRNTSHKRRPQAPATSLTTGVIIRRFSAGVPIAATVGTFPTACSLGSSLPSAPT